MIQGDVDYKESISLVVKRNKNNKIKKILPIKKSEISKYVDKITIHS